MTFVPSSYPRLTSCCLDADNRVICLIAKKHCRFDDIKVVLD